jgi:hypothetical protein
MVMKVIRGKSRNEQHSKLWIFPVGTGASNGARPGINKEWEVATPGGLGFHAISRYRTLSSICSQRTGYSMERKDTITALGGYL